jgi:hypothetical protein
MEQEEQSSARRRVRIVHGHWNITTKKQPQEQFKTWFPQHLSLGTKEQRRFQEPDVGGRVNKGYARWPKGGTKAYLGAARKKSKIFQTQFRQHLSLGTKEQRRFLDPDVVGRRKKVCTTRPQGTGN